MSYYVIYCFEDGDHLIKVYTEEELKKELQGYLEDGETPPEFGDPANPEFRLDYFAGMIIIKGDVIIPKPVDVVKSYSI